MKTISYKREDLLNSNILCPQSNFTRIFTEDLQNMNIIDSIIDESVYRDEWFDDFFAYASNVKQFMEHSSSLMKYFKNSPGIQKTLGNHHGDLYFEFLNFNRANFYFSLKKFTKEKVDENTLIATASDIFSKSKYSNGITITFPNERNFCLIFIDSSCSIDRQKNSLKHEFIHYLEWLEGKHKTTTSFDDNYYKEELRLLHKYLNVYKENLDYATSSNEYMTLLNDFLESLKHVKSKWYKDLANYDFSKKIVELLFRKSEESNEDYLKRVSKLVVFRMLKDKSSFLMVLFFNMINEKTTNIKNHIFGYFNGRQ